MRRANSPPKFRWPIIACRKHRFHPLKSGFLEVNESTGQRVNEFASWRVNRLVSDRSDKSDSADAAKCKSPLAPEIAPFATYINQNIN